MERFKIYITFKSGDNHVEDHDESTLADALVRLTQGPAAALGIIHEVKVVDMMDCTVWLNRQGRMVFPIKGVHY